MMKEMMMMIDRNKGNLTLGGVSNKSSIRQVLVMLFLKSPLVELTHNLKSLVRKAAKNFQRGGAA